MQQEWLSDSDSDWCFVLCALLCSFQVCMTDKSSDIFITPSRPLKRHRSHSSPGMSPPNMEGEKVGNLTHGQLMEGLAGLLDSKLARLATKDDLLAISNQVAVLNEENQALKEEISALRQEQRGMKAKLLDLEGRSRRNNLVFRGLKWDSQTRDFKQIVRKFCTEMFGTDDRLYVNRAHPLGRGNSVIIAHFPDDADVEYVMARCKKLKGTGFAVHRDYTNEVREKRRCLTALRAEVERVSGKRRMPIYFDHLTIEGSRFTWFDGKLRAGPLDGAKQLQEITKHDFTDFLKTLADGDSRTERRGVSAGGIHETAAANASQESTSKSQG